MPQSLKSLIRAALAAGAVGLLSYSAGCVSSPPVTETAAVTVTAPLGPPEPVDPLRFEKVVLAEGMDRPMTMAVASDGRIFFVELAGKVRMYNPNSGLVEDLATITVFESQESGLLGIALDPDFDRNNWIYLQYSHPVDAAEVTSRFTLAGDRLDMASETEIIRFRTDRFKDNCCHQAGSIAFGPDGNLFISAGDNTHPGGDSQGYAPIDERPDRSPFDAQKSAGNTMDIRGGIARIRPKAKGGYTIPAGNLFPKNGPIKGLPEIYVMGCRNPWRISVDQKTGYLYWGEVGPDAGGEKDGRGPRGYDELNQARAAGNFGWPYFIANNLAYNDWDFATNASGPKFDPAHPVNDSPNSYGSRDLPPANPAFIYYPGAKSDVFPELQSGGRTACAGPVYHFDPKQQAAGKLPRYYDNCMFFYEWSRHLILAVHLDANSDIEKIEPFLENFAIKRPIDIKFGADGAMYIIEYGDTWGKNVNCRLLRIDYIRGNRPPEAIATAANNIGKGPLIVKLSGKNSTDKDPNDALSYAWYRTGEDKPFATGMEADQVFGIPGTHTVMLKVTDSQGASSTTTVPVIVGNDIPTVTISRPAANSFVGWDEDLTVNVTGNDAEDGAVKAVNISFNAAAHEDPPGLKLMRRSDCFSCHSVSQQIVGPAFAAVADRYRDKPEAFDTLVSHVRDGSATVWGPIPMLPHPQHTVEEIRQMVSWVLTQGTTGKALSVETGRDVVIRVPKPDGDAKGRMILSASYTDQGAPAAGPLTGAATIELRPRQLEAETCLDPVNLRIAGNKLGSIAANSNVHFPDINLSGVSKITCRACSGGNGGFIEFRKGATDGELLAKIEVPVTGGWDKWQDFPGVIKDPGGSFDLFLVFTNPNGGGGLMDLDWVRFEK